MQETNTFKKLSTSLTFYRFQKYLDDFGNFFGDYSSALYLRLSEENIFINFK